MLKYVKSMLKIFSTIFLLFESLEKLNIICIKLVKKGYT